MPSSISEKRIAHVGNRDKTGNLSRSYVQRSQVHLRRAEGAGDRLSTIQLVGIGISELLEVYGVADRLMWEVGATQQACSGRLTGRSSAENSRPPQQPFPWRRTTRDSCAHRSRDEADNLSRSHVQRSQLRRVTPRAPEIVWPQITAIQRRRTARISQLLEGGRIAECLIREIGPEQER